MIGPERATATCAPPVDQSQVPAEVHPRNPSQRNAETLGLVGIPRLDADRANSPTLLRAAWGCHSLPVCLFVCAPIAPVQTKTRITTIGCQEERPAARAAAAVSRSREGSKLLVCSPLRLLAARSALRRQARRRRGISRFECQFSGCRRGALVVVARSSSGSARLIQNLSCTRKCESRTSQLVCATTQ